MKTINIARDFSDTPLGRFYPADGDYPGQRFRDEFLLPALQSEDKVVIEIDGTEGYGSSFLEEAFGGLVRKGLFTADQLRRKLELSSTDTEFKMYKTLIWKYISEAKPT